MQASGNGQELAADCTPVAQRPLTRSEVCEALEFLAENVHTTALVYGGSASDVFAAAAQWLREQMADNACKKEPGQ